MNAVPGRGARNVGYYVVLSCTLLAFALFGAGCGASGDGDGSGPGGDAAGADTGFSDTGDRGPDGDAQTPDGTDTGDLEPYPNAAQKGPFAEGAAVRIHQLDETGTRTDETLRADADAEGRWEIGAVDWPDGPVEIVVEGTFFDEQAGEFTDETRTLRAVAETAAGALDANVNIYTHLLADRILYLVEDDVAWPEARTQAQTELADLVRIETPARDLDILDARRPNAADHANLLSFSAALLAADLGQIELDEMADDFAEDGELDDEGEDHFDAILAAAFDGGIELFERARQNLIDQYGAAPELSVESGFGWYGTGCAIRTLLNPRLLCEDESIDLEVGEDGRDYLELSVDETASYAIAMKTDDYSRQRSWTVYSKRNDDGTFEGEMGSANSPGTITEDYITHRLRGGETYWIEIFNGADKTVFDVDFYRVSDGSRGDPLALTPGDVHRGVAGTHIGSGGNNDAYYQFDAAGEHKIVVEGFVCGGSVGGSGTGGDGVELALFERDRNDLADLFSRTSVARSQEETGACSQTITYGFQSDKKYFLRVRNRNFLKTFRPAPIGEDYKIHIREP